MHFEKMRASSRRAMPESSTPGLFLPTLWALLGPGLPACPPPGGYFDPKSEKLWLGPQAQAPLVDLPLKRSLADTRDLQPGRQQLEGRCRAASGRLDGAEGDAIPTEKRKECK